MIYLLGVLGTTRITRLLTEETIFESLREYFGLGHSLSGSTFLGTDNKLKDFIGRALGCFACTSVWVSLGQLVLLLFAPACFFYFNLFLSFSLLAIWLNPRL